MKEKRCSILKKILVYTLVVTMLFSCIPLPIAGAKRTVRSPIVVEILNNGGPALSGASAHSSLISFDSTSGKYYLTVNFNGPKNCVLLSDSVGSRLSFESDSYTLEIPVTIEEMLEAKLNSTQPEYAVKIVKEGTDEDKYTTVKLSVNPDGVSFEKSGKVVYPVSDGIKLKSNTTFSAENNGTSYVKVENNELLTIQCNSNAVADYTLSLPLEVYNMGGKCRAYIYDNTTGEWRLIPYPTGTNDYHEISSTTGTNIDISFTAADVKNANNGVMKMLLKCNFGLDATPGEYIEIDIDLEKLKLTKTSSGRVVQTFPALGKVDVSDGSTTITGSFVITDNETDYVVINLNDYVDIPYEIKSDNSVVWKLDVISKLGTETKTAQVEFDSLMLKDDTFSVEKTLDFGSKGNQTVVIGGETKYITLKKQEQTGFGFKNTLVADVIYPDAKSICNVAEGGEGTGTVSYTITDTVPYATVAADGTVTLNSDGEELVKNGNTVTVHVKATKQEAENSCHKDATAEYVVSFTKARLDFGFEQSECNVNYVKDGTFTNVVKDTDGNPVEEIKYSIDNESVATINQATGELTFVKSGTVVVTAVYTGDRYNTTAASYRLVINTTKPTENELSYTGSTIEIVYGSNGQIKSQDILNVFGLSILEYKSDDTNIASVDSNGIITPSGIGETQILISFNGEDRYDVSTPIAVPVRVKKADRGLSFNKSTDTITFNDNQNLYIIPALNDYVGKGEVPVNYSISSNSAIVSGNIVVKGAGEIVFTATIGETEFYNEAVTTFTLTVKKDTQSIAFASVGNNISKYYGIKQFSNVAEETGTAFGNGKISYAVDNTELASVDENGVLRFKDRKIGTVTVTATKAADENYEEATASYTVNVTRLTAPENNPCKLYGELGDNNYYRSAVKIKAEGYKLSFDDSIEAEFTDYLDYSTEGKNDVTVYLKDSSGAITEGLIVKTAIDTSAPTDLNVKPLENSFFDKILNFIFGKGKLKIEFSAKDLISGIGKIVYKLQNENGETSEEVVVTKGIKFDPETGIYSHIAEIGIKSGYAIVYSVYDAAGNVTEYDNTPKIFEDKAAEIKLEPTVSMVGLNKDGIITNNDAEVKEYLTNNDFSVNIKIKEENFDPKDVSVRVNDSAKADLNWSEEGDSHIAKIDFTSVGKYNLKVYYKDKLANESSADITVTYYNNSNIKVEFGEINKINNGAVYAKISVTDDYFQSTAVSFSDTTVTDINGKAVPFTLPADMSWEKEGENTYVSTLELNREGLYNLVFNYTDALCMGHSASVGFAIDSSAPDSVSFKYNNNSFLESVLFFKDTVEVKITISDSFSGVNNITLDLIKDEVFSSATTVELPEGLCLYADSRKYTGKPGGIQIDDNYAVKNGDTVEYTVRIPVNFRGRLRVTKACDNAGNESNFGMDNNVIVVDNVSPAVSFVYSGAPATSVGNVLYFNTSENAANLNIEIVENNFDKDMVTITDINEDAIDVSWNDFNNNSLHKLTAPISFSVEGEYMVSLEYSDASGNTQTNSEKINDGEEKPVNAGKVTSKKIIVDNTKPEISAEFNPSYTQNMFCNKEVSATISINEKNFNAAQSDLVKVSAIDVSGNVIELIQGQDWTIDSWKNEGAENKTDITFKKDGRYILTVNSTDFSGNKADEKQYFFTVDKTKPECVSVTTQDGNLVNNLINYFKDAVDITFVAQDAVAGIDYITVNAYETVDIATDIEFPENLRINSDGTFENYNGDKLSVKSHSYENGTLTVTLTVPAQFNGLLGFTATDNSGNVSSESDSDASVPLKYQYGIIVDNISPVCSVKWSPVGNENFVRFVDEENKDVVSDASAVRIINNGAISAEISIEEANFDKDDVKIEITKDGAEYIGFTRTEWQLKDGTHSCQIKLDDDGDYVLSISYTDKSSNKMTQYKSAIYTIDTTSPIVSFVVDKKDATVEGFVNTYFAKNVIGKITVIDRNIRADEFDIDIVAKNGDFDTPSLNWTQSAENKNEWTASIDFNADATYTVTLNCADLAGNTAREIATEFTVDRVAPSRKITLAEPARIVGKNGLDVENLSAVTEGDGSTLYYNQGTSVKIEITEVNFFDSSVIVEVNGERLNDIVWTQLSGYNHSAVISLSSDGDYVIDVKYTDPAGSSMTSYQSQKIVVDSIVSEISVAYGLTSPNQTVNGRDYFAGTQTATITIKEHNFRCNEVNVSVNGLNSKGKETAIPDYSAIALDSNNWKSEGDLHRLTLEFKEDANYSISVEYTDLAKNSAKTYSNEFTVDKLSPAAVEPAVTYSEGANVFEKLIEALTFRFYKSNAEVTFKVSDSVSAVDYFTVTAFANGSQGATDKVLPKNLRINSNGSFNAENAGFISKVKVKKDANDSSVTVLTFNVPAEFRGSFELSATDRSGNKFTYTTCDSLYKNGMIIVTDTVAPVVSVAFDHVNLKAMVESDGKEITRTDKATADSTTRYIYSDVTSARIEITEANFFNDIISVSYSVNGEKAKPVSVAWTAVEGKNDTYSTTVNFTDDGDYVLLIECADKSGNDAEFNGECDGKTSKAAYTSNLFTIDTTVPVVTITDKGTNNAFASKDYFNDNVKTAVIKVKDHTFRPSETSIVASAKDYNGTDVSSKLGFAPNLSDWSHWISSGEDEWTAEITFPAGATYSFEVNAGDCAKNQTTDKVDFTVDNTVPSELGISYGSPVTSAIINGLNNKYYGGRATVEMTAKDITSGIKYFAVETINVNRKSTNIILPEELRVFADGTVSGNVGGLSNISMTRVKEDSDNTEEYVLSFTIPTEFAGQFKFTAVDNSENSSTYSDNNVVVTDKVIPLREVSLSPSRIVNSEMKDVDTFIENDNSVLYFNEKAVLTFKITESNFYAEDVSITVNGKAVSVSEWTKDGITYTSSYSISGDGDYIVQMRYSDRAGNKMVDYTSQRIVIDTVAPVIIVDYLDKKPEQLINGRSYFNDTQKATITVKEHNFRPEDMIINVTAVDINGKNIKTFEYVDENNVKSYRDNGRSEKLWTAYEEQWRRDNDKYVLELEFSENANYTFDIEYVDLATNKSAEYEADMFTVDTVSPDNLKIEYSTSVLSQIIEALSFGFYNAKMNVTVSATDDISGIHRIRYSYKNATDVSSINQQMIDAIVENSRIIHSGNKSKFTFTIPNLSLAEREQFRGSVEFTAFDRSENSSAKGDTSVLVVDNIAPVVTVSYSEPINTANGVAYYNGNVEANIAVKEANFFSSDVNISVVKDGESYPVAVDWVDKSVDDHNGTFVLSEEGDYYVNIEYKDKSGNAMTPYASNRITVDKTTPSISVSNIKANSANNLETIGFTVTATDTNIDISAFSPVLTAVVRGENGSYETKQISLGSPMMVEAGKTYAYTVANLTEDAYYVLSCSVKDMATNSSAEMRMEDLSSAPSIHFSVNRDGSVFGVNEYTAKVMKDFYVFDITEDIVIYEINVDAIEKYAVKLNGKVLTEGQDYSTDLTANAGEWTRRTYSVKKSLFAEEGEYKIVIESTDKAESNAYSDVKDLNVSFVVDKTAPVLVITGLEDGGRYQTEEQTVVIIPSDDGGCLNAIKVLVMDSDGNPLKDESGNDISLRLELGGDELLNKLKENEGKLTFTVPEGLRNQVRIVCSDCAVSSDGKTNEFDKTFSDVTVSLSGWIIFYANKPLFYSTISGAILLIGGGATLLIIKKKKRITQKTAVTSK